MKACRVSGPELRAGEASNRTPEVMDRSMRRQRALEANLFPAAS